jgi:hypothetical protein
MRALTAAVILLSLGPELRSQRAVRPVDDGVPHYSSNAVGTQFAALWRERARYPYVCLVGRVALDSSSATFVQVDSLRVADEPWATCNDPAVMGMVKMVDEIPTGTTVDAWGEKMMQQLVRVALRQTNWRIIGVMFAVPTVTVPDTTAVGAPGSDSLRQSLVPAFVWLPRTPDNVRALDEFVPLHTER